MGVTWEGYSSETCGFVSSVIASEGRDGKLNTPSLLLILLLNVRSGRSIVLATARTINLLCRNPGQLKKLYMTLWFFVTS